MAEILTGLARFFLGGFLTLFLLVFMWGAIKNPETRKHFLKTSRVAPPTPAFNAMIWVVAIVSCIAFAIVAYDGLKILYDKLA